MSEKLQIKKPLYPLFSLAAGLLIIVVGLLSAKNEKCLLFVALLVLLYVCFGYWKACLAAMPVAACMSVVLVGLTWLISRDPLSTYAALMRILVLCVCVIPSLALPPIYLVRSLAAVRAPRAITLAMMITFHFFPLLFIEIRRVREAMQTRGAGSLLSPKIFYRAFLIPLLMRLVNISDTLALSVETRGFALEGPEAASYSVYKPVRPRALDFCYLAVVLILCGWLIWR